MPGLLQYEIVTPPQPDLLQDSHGRPIMLAALGGGPGMTSGYLRNLITPFPSILIDWARVDGAGHPLRGPDIQLEAQAVYIEACRQQMSQELGSDIALLPVAHSAAGPRGIVWASRYPEHAAGLVLVDSFVATPKLPYSPVTLLLHLLAFRLRQRCGWEEAFRARFAALVGKYYFVAPTEQLQEAFSEAFIPPFWNVLFGSGVGRWDVRKQFNALQIPVCVIHGEADQIIPYKQQAEISRAQLTLMPIPGAGHLPMLERPSATAEALAEFVKSVYAQRA